MPRRRAHQVEEWIVTELRADPTTGGRTLVAINQRVHEAVTTTLKLYDLIRAAKDLGYS